MRFFCIIFLLFGWSPIVCASENYRGFLEVDFDYSMGIEDSASFRKLFIKPEGKKSYNFFKDLYNQNKPSKKTFSAAPIIPKIIHQVWVGGNELPAIYKFYQKTCKDLHPDWEYKLWTDKEVENWDFENKDLYNHTRNYAEKSDILRHQILKDFGGVYIDIDIRCTKPLDPLHYLYDAYFGLEFPLAGWGKPIIAPGIMASRAHHKIVTAILERIRQDWDDFDKSYDAGAMGHLDYGRIFHSIGIMRSMKPVTDVFLEQTKLSDNVIALPATYFYPLIRLTGERFTDSLPIRILRSSFDYLINIVDPFVSESMHIWLYDHYRQKDPFFVKGVRQESFSYHDYFEKNTTLVDITFDEGFGLYDKRRKKLFKSISPSDKIKYNIFASFYHTNNPYYEVKFNHKNKINPNLHFINLDGELSDKDQSNIESWKKLNPELSTYIWDQKSIEAAFPGVLAKARLIDDVNLRDLYVALNIMRKEGGIYINKRNLKGLKDLYELNNKYDLYCGFLPFSKINRALTIDSNFFAARANHWVIDRILKDIDLSKENFDLLNLIKQDLYKYQALGGKNIILPPVYFHPLDSNVRKQNLFDHLHQFYYDYKLPFTAVNNFNSFALNDD